MSKPPFNDHLVEEADIEICAAGWDNLLLPDTTELEEYLAALNYLNAQKCAAIIKELLDLVASTCPESPIELPTTHKKHLNDLWRRYNAASVAENPQELSRLAFQAAR